MSSDFNSKVHLVRADRAAQRLRIKLQPGL
jgi:hypothetical protein